MFVKASLSTIAEKSPKVRSALYGKKLQQMKDQNEKKLKEAKAKIKYAYLKHLDDTVDQNIDKKVQKSKKHKKEVKKDEKGKKSKKKGSDQSSDVEHCAKKHKK